jgi:hypothetical protein
MASDARAKLITLHFTQGEKTYGLRMAYGTALALGIDESELSTGYKTANTTAKNGIQRRLYPGGPSVTYNRAAGQRQVAVGPGSGRARTNKKVIVRADSGGSATIYFSGPQAAAVAWLYENTNIAEDSTTNGYQLFSVTGRPLSRKQSTQSL